MPMVTEFIGYVDDRRYTSFRRFFADLKGILKNGKYSWIYASCHIKMLDSEEYHYSPASLYFVRIWSNGKESLVELNLWHRRYRRYALEWQRFSPKMQDPTNNDLEYFLSCVETLLNVGEEN